MKGDKVVIKCQDGREELFHLFALVAERMLTEDEQPKSSAAPTKLLQ